MIKLNVFAKAYQLSLRLHQLSLSFPQHEQAELARQLRRASKSICANLVEGFGKNASVKEKRRYVLIAIGSKDEVILWLHYARDLSYLRGQQFEELFDGYDEVGKMLYGLAVKLKADNKNLHLES